MVKRHNSHFSIAAIIFPEHQWAPLSPWKKTQKSAFEDAFEDPLNVLVIMTEKRGNWRNDLKEDILKAVSSLRKEFANLKSEVDWLKYLEDDQSAHIAVWGI